MKSIHRIFINYVLAAVALVLFSYTQVDLNLTLSRVGVAQTVQKAFQHVGFYQRPLATVIYIAIIVSFFILYMTTLRLVRERKVANKTVWQLIFTVGVILVFSYPAAFSYDFFNYLFTAKTVLVYHQNPYTVTPLGFAGIDPWTNFMRWTHLTSAYTPLWIGISLVPYIAGLGYFILVLFAMKFMVAGFFLLAAYGLTKAVEHTEPKHSAYALAVFALNPLILVESLVSGHNDIVLAAFAMLSVWMYVSRTMYMSWLFLAFSIAAKLMTILLVPVYILRKNKQWMLAAMAVGLGLVLLKREFLPWYAVWILPFVALNYEKTKIIRMSIIISFGLVLSYAPYIYFGEYSVAEQLWKTSCVWIGVLFAVLSCILPDRSRISVK